MKRIIFHLLTMGSTLHTAHRRENGHTKGCSSAWEVLCGGWDALAPLHVVPENLHRKNWKLFQSQHFAPDPINETESSHNISRRLSSLRKSYLNDLLSHG